MPWSAEEAVRKLWSEIDTNVTNGEMMRFLRGHLQEAFDAGQRSANQNDHTS